MPPRLAFERSPKSPILRKDDRLAWQFGGIFNPAVAQYGQVFHMIFRAQGEDGISRLGYAQSRDGLDWKMRPEPLLEPLVADPQENGGMEDPRISKIGDTYYIVYTAPSRTRGGINAGVEHWETTVRYLITKDFQNFERVLPNFPLPFEKDVVLFPEKISGLYWAYHRIEKPHIWVSKSLDLLNWRDHKIAVEVNADGWDSGWIGAGTPPLRTPIGWLEFYHGVSGGVYSMGAFLTAIDDPARILYRLPYPLLWPQAEYERVGVVPNVVFGTGLVETEHTYSLYYGAADTSIALAQINKQLLLAELKQYPVTAHVPAIV